ncbi:MAG: xanthine dehydrogenase family protein molybdopterin-binding subunit [Steroidobacteraceae bacterium]
MNTAAPPPRDNQGQPFPRADALPKVTGAARYAADVPVPNLTYGTLVGSTIARGEVRRIELEAARGIAGVLAVFSYGDLNELRTPRFSTSSFTSLAPLRERKIWHDGQIMALIVAESFQAAEEGAAAVTADYAQQTPSTELDSPGTQILEAAGKVAMLDKDPCVGDFDRAYRDSRVRFEAEYRTPTQTHNPIELFSTTAVWSGDELTIYEPSQAVYAWRAELAWQLDMDPARIRVVSAFVGGGFGSKGPMTPRTAIVALAARRLDRPVRCVVSRAQGFTTQPYRAPTRHYVKLGAMSDGRITAFSHEGWELTSRKDNYAVAGTTTTTRLYGYGSVASKVRIVKADRQTPAFMRSPPELPYLFALESAMDELAWELKLDPIELRRRNEPTRDAIEGKPFSSRHLLECFEEGARTFHWSDRLLKPTSMRVGDWLVGLGCATAVYPTHVGPAVARVRLSADGRVRVQCATHEIGTGIRTAAGQVAAEELGIDPAAVTVETGDTLLPPAPVSGGSNSTASVCSAVQKACRQIRTQLAPGGGRMSLIEAFERLGTPFIEECGQFVPEGAGADALEKLYEGQAELVGGPEGPQLEFAFGAEFVEVRVHARTCEIRVPRVLGVFAAGRIVNPRTARSQLMGGLIWGVSSALHESTMLDPRTARTVNRDLQDYLVPVNADMDAVDVIMLSEKDDIVNPAGIKGLGELGNVGTNAAVANAIFHATGRRIRTLPIRLEQLL